MSRRLSRELLLAVYPFSRGFAFTYFEGPLAPVDWGIKEISSADKNARAIAALRLLVDRLQPDALIIQDCTGERVRRAQRIKRLHQLIRHFVTAEVIDVHAYSREQVRACFSRVGAQTRFEIAQALAGQIRAFGHRLPPVRKIWQSEDPRMSLFDAAALVMTHYAATEPASDDAS